MKSVTHCPITNMKNDTVRWLITNTRKVQIKLLVAVVLRILVAVCTVLFALLMKDLIDSAVNHNPAGIKQFSFAVIIITLLLYIGHVCSLYIQESIAVQTMSDFRSSLLMNLMTNDYTWIKSEHSGHWMNLLFSDIRIVGGAVSSVLPEMAGTVSRLAFSFVTLIFLAPVLAGVYLVAGILIFWGVSQYKGKLKDLHREVQEKEDRLHAVFKEIIDNLLIIKAFTAEEHFDKRIQTVQRDYSVSRLKRRKYRLLSVNLFSLVFRMGYLVALIYGGYQLLNNTVTYGTLTAVLHLVSQIQTPVYTLSGVLPKIYEAIASAERLIQAEKGRNEEHTEKTSKTFEMMQIKNVDYSYGREEVLKNVSFKIRSGEFVALTGISGGGKSTLFLLVLGMFSPNKGTIEIQTEAGTIRAGAQTRNLFAYVPQGNAMFTGTIKDNIIFNHKYDRKRLENALRIADAYDFVMNLPKKSDTGIGERGVGLSEGQLQRIAIARAIYSDASVLLFDESTSALDEATEARVLLNIRKLKDKTVMIVTHRPAALKICERHLIVENHRAFEVDYE